MCQMPTPSPSFLKHLLPLSSIFFSSAVFWFCSARFLWTAAFLCLWHLSNIASTDLMISTCLASFAICDIFSDVSTCGSLQKTSEVDLMDQDGHWLIRGTVGERTALYTLRLCTLVILAAYASLCKCKLCGCRDSGNGRWSNRALGTTACSLFHFGMLSISNEAVKPKVSAFFVIYR